MTKTKPTKKGKEKDRCECKTIYGWKDYRCLKCKKLVYSKWFIRWLRIKRWLKLS